MKKNFSILCIDSDRNTLTLLDNLLRKKYRNVFLANDFRTAMESIIKNNIDLVLLDLKAPEEKDFEIIESIKKKSPDSLVIILTGYSSSIENVVNAIKKGAEDFLVKPLNSHLLSKIEHYLNNKEGRRKNHPNIVSSATPLRFENFIGNSYEIERILKLIQKVADFDITILIQGESGTGKQQSLKEFIKIAIVQKKCFFPSIWEQ